MCTREKKAISNAVINGQHSRAAGPFQKKHLDACEALMSALEASPQTRHFVIATVMGQWEGRPFHQCTSPLLCFYTTLFDSYL